MSLVVEVEVVRDDALPYRGGVAVVRVDGVEVAKLRSCEATTITIPDPAYSINVDAPFGLKDAAPCCEEIGFEGCGLPLGHAGRHRLVRTVAAREPASGEGVGS